MRHLEPDQVLEMLTGSVSEESRRSAEHHLGGCSSCRGVLAELATESFVGQRVATRVGVGALAERYELVAPIGRGGMGIVYRATPIEGGPDVALKWMRIDGELRSRERFEREARLAKSLSHPGLVRTLDYGELGDSTLYIAMELLEGEDLQRRVQRDGPLAPPEVARIGVAIADALEHAHRACIVHRDVKPSNVFLCSDGTVKLLDFGLAIAHDTERLTRSFAPIGTPAYMAPEQIEATADEDPRTDVWGLAATLYTALAGRPPFAAERAITMALKIAREEPDPLADHIPPGFRATVLRGLSKRRCERWQTPKLFGDALQKGSTTRAAESIASR